MRSVYVDVDGTLLASTLDARFSKAVKAQGLGAAVQWYESHWCSNLKVNWVLVAWLVVLKTLGYRLVLWTNRGPRQRPMTKANLGWIWGLFSDHMFLEGKKAKSLVQGTVIDNELKYQNCGTRFILINWK